MRATALLLASLLLLPQLATAQASAPSPVTVGKVVVSGSLRTRIEAWNWFDGAADGDYVYSGSIARLSFRESLKRVDWQVEFAVPVLLGLPDEAIAAGAQGQAGLGAAYYAANSARRNAAHLFVKQAFVRFKNPGGRSGQALSAGRFEFVDGAEAVPSNATLAAVKRERVAHRLLGTFGFAHVGRSFDGIQYSSGASRVNVTAVAARPTRGVFQVDGWDELDVSVFYGAVTAQAPRKTRSAEWRAFVLGYRDDRTNAIKTDSRPLTVRRGDTSAIGILTVGAHYLGAISTRHGVIDVLAWGALQRGSWGNLSQRAGAVAIEAGWQPLAIARLRPWIRGGWNRGSGDGDASDTTHGTFFQVLPTPRIYARFPFFNMMNTSDGFAEIVLRPSARVTTRFDAHAIRLSAVEDLWYQGGGAFQSNTFGYSGRPSNGSSALATLLDAGAEYAAGPHASVGTYYGLARGGAVVGATYPGRQARFGYAEVTLRF